MHRPPQSSAWSSPSDRKGAIKQTEMTVYRGGSPNADVCREGLHIYPTESLVFQSTKGGILTRLYFSEACFDYFAKGAGVMGTSDYSQLAANVVVVEMAESCVSKTLQKTSTPPCHYSCLPLSRKQNLSNSKGYGFVTAQLWPPIQFKKNAWTAVEVEFAGLVRNGGGGIFGSFSLAAWFYPSSMVNLLSTGHYAREFVDEMDSSIKFTFRTVQGSVAPLTGVVDHFDVILNT